MHMPAERLARLRWAVSPVGELAAALVAASEAPPGDPSVARVRALLGSGRLPTLAAVAHGFTVYLPELLTPPARGFLPGVEEQLHAVATARTSQVGTQFTAFLAGGTARRRRCPWLKGTDLDGADDQVRARIETSESGLRERLAGELHLLWSELLAGHWAGFVAGYEEFVERQARTTARHGLGDSLAALHSSMAWRGGALEIASPHVGEVGGASPLTLIPSQFLRRIALHSPLLRQGGQLVVPVSAPRDARRVHVAPVLGVTRLAILESLTRPRTTTELAARHHLTPGTVSFHLARLLAADLVRRARTGRLVHYTATARARTLLREAGDWGD
ncbi:winged helix-turn-helix transcriptional regulator [Streptomyces daliensis]|uniref:Winged helix-turn-helix transcriptional regulator n=1 Tax=Streptomyces daliensis TaxID=299421 RepID=A0A8T4J8T2_9ACTN|nr:winged helix-turn-helix transcriptional regulator [Streptomyces daliensis]